MLLRTCHKPPRLALLLLLLLLCACQRVFQPLRPDAEQTAQAAAASRTVLLRFAVCWPALPLVQDLLAERNNTGGAGDPLGADVSVEVVPTDSATALGLARAGQADLAIVAWQPTAEDLAWQGEGQGPALRAQPLAVDRVGIIVHKDWPLRNLTTQELGDLFRGRVSDWKALRAGEGQPELVSLVAGADTQQVFQHAILGERALSSTAILMPHDRAVLQYVALHPGAIGYVSVAYHDERVKWVTIDGLSPTAAETPARPYPLTRPLVLITANHPSSEVQDLVSLATSARGQQIISRNGLEPTH
jgi:phosphate transport system substrate-binding protein